VLHVARWKCMTQKLAKKLPSGHHCRTLSGHIFASKALINNPEKNLLSSNISSTCHHNMVNFGSLAAEIDPVVWGTPATCNGFRVLAALLHGTPVWASAKLCGVEQRAPPIFGRVAITLGIGPHSSFILFHYSFSAIQNYVHETPFLKMAVIKPGLATFIRLRC